MASILDTVPIERINTQARQIQFRRVLLTLIAGLFYVLGWTVARAFGVLWLALAWSATAIKVGWQEGRRARDVDH